MEKCQDLRKEASQLKPPAQQRKAALDLSLQFHEFHFDLQRELEWIAEKITIILGRYKVIKDSIVLGNLYFSSIRHSNAAAGSEQR